MRYILIILCLFMLMKNVDSAVITNYDTTDFKATVINDLVNNSTNTYLATDEGIIRVDNNSTSIDTSNVFETAAVNYVTLVGNILWFSTDNHLVSVNIVTHASTTTYAIANITSLDYLADPLGNDTGVWATTSTGIVYKDGVVQQQNSTYNPIEIKNGYYKNTVDNSDVLALNFEQQDSGTQSITDLSDTGHTFIFSGDVEIRDNIFKYGSKSLYFDGASDSIITSDNLSDWNFSNKIFTVEFWMLSYINNTYIISNWDASGSRAWRVGTQTGTGKLYWNWSTNGATTVNQYSNADICDSTWHHCAVVMDGTLSKLYIDGVEQADSVNVTTVSDSTNALYLGSDRGSNVFKGYLDNIRIVRRALYTSNFIPPNWSPQIASVSDTTTIVFDNSLGIVQDFQSLKYAFGTSRATIGDVVFITTDTMGYRNDSGTVLVLTSTDTNKIIAYSRYVGNWNTHSDSSILFSNGDTKVNNLDLYVSDTVARNTLIFAGDYGRVTDWDFNYITTDSQVLSIVRSDTTNDDGYSLTIIEGDLIGYENSFITKSSGGISTDNYYDSWVIIYDTAVFSNAELFAKSVGTSDSIVVDVGNCWYDAASKRFYKSSALDTITSDTDQAIILRQNDKMEQRRVELGE